MYLDPNINKQGDLYLVDDPATKVVTVAEIKEHLRIDTTYEDTLLGLYIDSATEMAENYCARHFITHEYELYFNEVVDKASLIFPDCTLVVHTGGNSPYGVNVIDENGFQIGSDAAYLDAFSNPSIVYLASTYPAILRNTKKDASNVFWYRFKTGFGDAASDVPQAIKQAIMLIVGDMYYFREDRKRSFPMASEILLQPYKCYH
jgi:uncharacterized phiE125 gp8 family phage protein